ncbi:MAG: ParB/RepB/Spo0J family partition protein, partial [Dehalococcoidia bacterium]|nr:ParB/RepB/Spo0J family partition protein [Dehalococcoidia bacterium]
MKLKTPFANLLPPLSTEEREALAADIDKYGVTHPIIIDEEGNILDGHHRYAIDPKAPTIIRSGMSELEKQAFVMSTNDGRRNMSVEQRRELRKSQQKLCRQLKKDDPNRWTQEELAALFVKDQSIISDWLNMPNMGTHIRHKTDARVKLPTQAKKEIVDRVNAGERQEQIAA